MKTLVQVLLFAVVPVILGVLVGRKLAYWRYPDDANRSVSETFQVAERRTTWVLGGAAAGGGLGAVVALGVVLASPAKPSTSAPSRPAGRTES